MRVPLGAWHIYTHIQVQSRWSHCSFYLSGKFWQSGSQWGDGTGLNMTQKIRKETRCQHRLLYRAINSVMEMLHGRNTTNLQNYNFSLLICLPVCINCLLVFSLSFVMSATKFAIIWIKQNNEECYIFTSHHLTNIFSLLRHKRFWQMSIRRAVTDEYGPLV
jgi:hypothetical protein